MMTVPSGRRMMSPEPPPEDAGSPMTAWSFQKPFSLSLARSAESASAND
jgi:hypothetical protein